MFIFYQPLPFFFIILLIIALFYENVDNYLVRFCQFFVFFYILSSIILFIALNIEQTFFILSELVGSFSLKLLHGIITSRIRLCLILVLIKWRKRYSMPTTKEKKMLKTKNLLRYYMIAIVLRSKTTVAQ